MESEPEIILPMPELEMESESKIMDRDALVDAIRKLLKEVGTDRTFWVDKALIFLQIRDKIPQRLIDHKRALLHLAEPWLRAAAERGVCFEEDEELRAAAGQNLFESLLHISPWHRWFTAKVAAENGHKQMVLDLIQGHDPNELVDYLLMMINEEAYSWLYIIWRFLVVESAPPQTDNLQEWNSLAVKEKSFWGGWTFLHFAAAKGDLACVEVLRRSHVDLDGRTKEEGYTALHLASYHDNAAIVDLLLKDGAKVDQPDKEGRMPLHLASERGCLASVNALLEQHAKHHSFIMEEFKDGNGMTPLHLAACRGETEVVRKLMTFTQNPNQKCSQDLLHEKFFIAHSLSRKRDETVRIDMPWYLEASCFDHATFELQPEDRLKSEVWSPGGFTALHFAVVYGNADTVREILQHGERGTVHEMLSTTQDNLGLTPADWAEVVDLKGKIGRVIQCSERNKAKPILPADGHEEGSLMQLFPSSCRKVTSCSNFGKANIHYEEVKEAEGERLRLQWTVDIGEALVAKKWGEARWLIRQGVKDKIKIDDVMWEHLKWAMTAEIFRKPLIERMMVELVEGEAFSNSSSTMQGCLVWAMEQDMVDVVKAIVRETQVDVVKASFSISSSTMQRCLMWAMEQEMVELVEAIVKDGGKNKCELLSVARGCEEHIKKSPLETATDMGGELGSQLVAVMEQREDVQRRLYEDRQVYVDYANTILVAAVLIAALAFQGWVQSPQGYAAMSPAADAKGIKGMLVFARCNTLGFVLAMGAVIAGAVGAMPLRSGRFVKFREKSSRAAATASLLMVASVACEVVGFAVAVASDVKPQYRKEMLVSTRFGTTIVFLLSAWFLIRLNELQPLLDLLLHALPNTLLLPIDLIKSLLHSLYLSVFYRLFHTRSFQLLVFKPFDFYVFQPFKSSSFGSCLSRSFETLNNFLRSAFECPLSECIEEFYDYVELKFKTPQESRLDPPPPKITPTTTQQD